MGALNTINRQGLQYLFPHKCISHFLVIIIIKLFCFYNQHKLGGNTGGKDYRVGLFRAPPGEDYLRLHLHRITSLKPVNVNACDSRLVSWKVFWTFVLFSVMEMSMFSQDRPAVHSDTM